ncbi:DNA-binding protein [Enemella dayhoffiae]|uniref:DNA-binding protein n=1 Tax=Enemella dayhoffiae TaxID=2016507 RepID=A0A255H326_9ACTN|nr:OB-fold nucleic acid binding domain-containing protein [Enemella dayhoffiae]OYO21987.1 DNA-binding protein [Enemella dayhoffiae]
MTQETRQRRGIGEMLRRMVRSNDDLEAEDLRREAAQAGCSQVSGCKDRQRVTLRGTISSVTLNPPGEARQLEVDFRDGSGSVRLIWMGRRAIPGIQAGTNLTVQGRIAHNRGDRVMYNPRYELLQVPRS